MKQEIAASFNDRVYQGGLTYNGHPVSLAAAIANLHVMQSDHLVEKARETGKVMADLLAELVERHPSVGEVRSIGLFGVIELVKNKKTREPLSPWNQTNAVMKAVDHYLLEHGVYINTHWHTILLVPPLIITADQLAEGFAVMDQALEIADRAADRV
jgi:taurine--2-oxoglutarate transaminase